jgi:hypothetical protein
VLGLCGQGQPPCSLWENSGGLINRLRFCYSFDCSGTIECRCHGRVAARGNECELTRLGYPQPVPSTSELLRRTSHLPLPDRSPRCPLNSRPEGGLGHCSHNFVPHPCSSYVRSEPYFYALTAKTCSAATPQAAVLSSRPSSGRPPRTAEVKSPDVVGRTGATRIRRSRRAWRSPAF